MGRKRACVVTGCRAEYGLLQGVIEKIAQDNELELQIVATGMHLSPEFGLTRNEIVKDGYEITEQIEMLLSSDSSIGVIKSMGLGMIGFADAYKRLNPDIVVVLGDRFEIFAAATAAFIARIPIAHIGGGDVTEGAFDDSIRHSITKMANLHFVTNEDSRRRVCQLGENKALVHLVGHPGIDRIRTLKLLTKESLEKVLNFKFQKQNFLVTYHPATLSLKDAGTEFNELLSALSEFSEDTGILLTKSNADPQGRVISSMIDKFTKLHENASSYVSLGQLNYFSVVKYVDIVIGNSSSGICEVPSLNKPTVNIGDRQKGRFFGKSVIFVPF